MATKKKITKKKTAAKKTSVGKTMTKTAASKTAKAPKPQIVYKLKVGDAAPRFSVASTNGEKLSLKDFAGKKLVLYFYPKDNTPGCTLEGHDFRKLHGAFKKAGAEIIGVSRDSLKSHASFKEKCGFPFELLSDEDGSLCKSFDVIQMKSLYGRKFEGIERSTFVIDSRGKVAREWRKVKVDGHAQAVLEFVETMD
jgi:peroxiredoxin Q/BCP